MKKIDLLEYGFDEYFKEKYEEYKEKYDIARVIIEYKGRYKIITEYGEALAKISGKMNYNTTFKEEYPKVGDWVLIDKNYSENTIIHSILERKSKFSRKEAGDSTDEQVMAVNIDTIFICMSLNEDFNLRRLERYLTMSWNSGASPVIILTKADICDDINSKVQDIENISFGVEIIITSSVKDEGFEDLNKYIKVGKTVAFLGSSGVGKSTLINHLLKEDKLKTQDIRFDDAKGRHTTTHRELILLPDGGVVIDTPGMREFHILDTEDGVDTTFEDIEQLSKKCKFNDCKHKSEPGCAIKEAIKNGDIEEKRLTNYNKLQREARYISNKLKQKERKEIKSKSKKNKKCI